MEYKTRRAGNTSPRAHFSLAARVTCAGDAPQQFTRLIRNAVKHMSHQRIKWATPEYVDSRAYLLGKMYYYYEWNAGTCMNGNLNELQPEAGNRRPATWSPAWGHRCTPGTGLPHNRTCTQKARSVSAVARIKGITGAGDLETGSGPWPGRPGDLLQEAAGVD